MEKLIESDRNDAEEPVEAEENGSVESEPRDAARNTGGDEPNWLLWIALFLVAAGLIVGLVFLARWIYHETKNQSNPTNTQTSHSQSKNSSNSSSSANKGSSSSGNNQSSTSSTSSNNLPNNGPGNVIGIFAAASFAAGALHYVISLRKTAREN